ncbi:MAG: hypothetical protein ACO3S8_07060 [Aquiluna sp.]|jgi:hypothetical protein
MAERFVFKNFYVKINDDGTGYVQRGDDSTWGFSYDHEGNLVVTTYTGEKPKMARHLYEHIQHRLKSTATKDRPDKRVRSY